MPITVGFNHVATLTTDLDRLAEFYAKAFDATITFQMEAADDQAVTAWALKVGSLGNVRTQTLRAFRANEIENILAKVN